MSIKKIKISLTETPENNQISEDYFFRMLSPQAVKIAKPYDNEEKQILLDLLKNNSSIKDFNFIAVGSGELWGLKLSSKYCKNYIGIEPLSKMYINSDVSYLVQRHQNIKIINKKFGEVFRNDFPEGKSLFVFLFNILAYIDNPVKNINNILRKGDILYISTWNTSEKARIIREKYFDYLNGLEKKVSIDPNKSVGLCHLDHFPFDRLKFYSHHKRIKGKIADILIIYT